MTQGTFQIAVYCIVLVGLGYPLGLYMARVYAPGFRVPGLSGLEGGFCRLLRADPRREQDWKAYGRSVIVFSVLFSVVLYALQRLQAHLFLNPDGVKGVPSHIA